MESTNPYNIDYYAQLEHSLGTLLSIVKPPLTSIELTDFYLYIDQREYGLAFDEIAGVLDERRQPIDLQTYDLIDKLGTQMGLQPQNWKHLQDLVSKAN